MGIKDCIDGVAMFNEIAGNLNSVSHENLVAQAKCVKEEGDELLEAVQHTDVNEILKECVDVLVTIHGFVQMLEEQGYNVLDAWKNVNSNNLSKFCVSTKDVEDSVAYYRSVNVPITVEQNDFFQVFVLKDENGKIRKPVSYKKCSVASYTPKGVMPKKEVV